MYSFSEAKLEDLKGIALLRNKIKDSLTHDKEDIDPSNQANWYLNVKKDCDKLYAFTNLKTKEVIGYGFIQYIDNVPWLTGALDPEFQGYGYGKQIFQSLIERIRSTSSETPIFLDVLKSNYKAVNLYFKLGFKIISEQNELYIMRLN